MKKTLKNLLIAIICVCMLITIVGCGKKDETDETSKSSKSEVKNVAAETKETEKTETKTTEEAKVEFSMGEWKGNTYENNFLGIKFELPSGWERLDDEQIAEMMDLGAEIVSNDLNSDIEEIKNLNAAYYLSANDPQTGDNITIMSEKPTLNATTERYIESLKTGLQQVTTLQYTIGETSKETIAGRTYDTLTTTVTVNGISLVQKYYVYKIDKYFLGIIATSATGNNGITTMMKAFK